MNTQFDIVATLGPASESVDTIEQLIQAGLTYARLNFSHGTHDNHERLVGHIRTAAKRTGKKVSIIADLQGPKLRIGSLPKVQAELKKNETISIVTRPVGDDEVSTISIPADIFQGIRVGDEILLGDGIVSLRVLEAAPEILTATVLTGGIIRSHNGFHVPTNPLNIPILTTKDKEDLMFALSLRVSHVAASFVRTAEDIRIVRTMLQGTGIGADVKIIAKLERPQAIENLVEIVEATDMVMVARGDLGIEMPLDQVPVLTKKIIDECRRQHKQVIVATQMMESMMENARPTRAEVSDIAHAVWDGATGTMLSEETAMGKYPVEAVTWMRKVITSAQS